MWRDWSCLPGPILLCISQHLEDFVDYFAFAGTCSVWRDVANFGKKTFMLTQPPLLCSFDGKGFYSPLTGKCFKNLRIAALIRRLRGAIVDVSHGYFVVESESSSPSRKKIVLLNPLTSHIISNLPKIDADFLHWILLTARPTSPDCIVVACTSVNIPRWAAIRSTTTSAIKYVRPGDCRWTLFDTDSNVDLYTKPVVSIDRRIFALIFEDDSVQLVALELLRHGPNLKYACLGTLTRSEIGSYMLSTNLRGELLLVRASSADPADGRIGDVKTYGFDSSRHTWVPKSGDSLDDCALIMNYTSCSAAAIPRSWGGRGGEIYFSAGHGRGAWKFTLQSGVVVASHSSFSPPLLESERRHGSSKFPPPVLWLLPGTCL